MRQGLFITLTVFILLVVIGALLAFDVGRKNPDTLIASFDDCIRAGYPALESYPRQCATADGKHFIEVIETPNPLVQATTTATSTATSSNPGQPTATDLVTNISVKPGATITSPLIITGDAKGPWYFEATFPIQLNDANGTMIVESYGTAQGDWMTTDFVPFEATLTFTKPATATGTLVIMNANASGDEGTSLELVIPVTFSQ